MSSRHHTIFDAKIEIPATPRDETLVAKSHADIAKRDFNYGLSFIVPDENICDARRKWIKRATRSDTNRALTDSATILNTCLRSSAKGLHRHLPNESNSARVIERK